MSKASLAWLVLIPIVALGLNSCVRSNPLSVAQSTATPFVPVPETGPYTVIGHIEHRDRIITVKSGEQGVVYSARTRAGESLFENLTMDQMMAKSPEIHDFIEAATAGSATIVVPRASLSPLR
jgi:hypothetical protein